MAKVLEEQRKLSPIDRQKLAHLAIRGKHRWDVYKTMEHRLISAGVDNNVRVFEMSREELYEEGLRFSQLVYKNAQADLINVNYVYETAIFSNLHLKGSVGNVMVVQLILAIGSEEQKALFLPPINAYQWTTAYAQTEIGTGSDVDSIKTVAVYDEAKQRFVFNTPNLEAVKWWPGDLAMSATHIILVARLISKGVDHGVQFFFVQVRDPKTHKLLEGIESGDIGPKVGFNSKDNGFMRFTGFKAPKIALLSKYIQIGKEGEVIKSGNDKVKYSGMMSARTLLLMSSYFNMFRALTITTRYSLLRKQFRDAQGREMRIFDYQLQRFKIARHLSKTYAMSLGLYKVMELINQNERAVHSGDFSYFQQIHLLLCQCKAFFTWWDFACVSECITACGGHGFSSYSGLVTPYTENFANSILEGENSLLCLQVARYLLTLSQKLAMGKTELATGQFAYLVRDAELSEWTPPNDAIELAKFETVLQIMQKNAAFFIKKTAMGLLNQQMEGKEMKDAFNFVMGSQLLNMAKCHSLLALTENFLTKLASLEHDPIKEAITSLAYIYVYEILTEQAASFLESESLGPQQMAVYEELSHNHLEKVTPHLLVLTEALQIDETILKSAIAHPNEKPYENLYLWAKNFGSLNHLPNGVHPEIAKLKLMQEKL